MAKSTRLISVFITTTLPKKSSSEFEAALRGSVDALCRAYRGSDKSSLSYEISDPSVKPRVRKNVAESVDVVVEAHAEAAVPRRRRVTKDQPLPAPVGEEVE